MSLAVVPVTLEAANEIVRQWHRHHGPKISGGTRFAIGAAEDGEIVGVVIVATPVARFLMDGWSLEVSRSCTNGARNANSLLYGAAWRATRSLGFHRLITYILPQEGGASLRATGWRCCGETGGDCWVRPNRVRVDKTAIAVRLRWEITSARYEQLREQPPPSVDAGVDAAQLRLFEEAV